MDSDWHCGYGFLIVFCKILFVFPLSLLLSLSLPSPSLSLSLSPPPPSLFSLFPFPPLLSLPPPLYLSFSLPFSAPSLTPASFLPLIGELEGWVEALAGTCNAQAVANTLWAYATTGREPGAAAMRALERRWRARSTRRKCVDEAGARGGTDGGAGVAADTFLYLAYREQAGRGQAASRVSPSR